MKSRQSGSVLAISLVLLTAITLIALMGLQRSGLQTKIVANIQHKERTYHAAYSELECIYESFRIDSQSFSDAKDKAGEDLNLGIICANPLAPLAPSNHLTITNNLRLVDNGNALGNPNTSMIIDEKSRGSRGAGMHNFQLETVASLPNDIASNQLYGIPFILD